MQPVLVVTDPGLRQRVGDYVEEQGVFRIHQRKDKRQSAIRLVPATPRGIGACNALAAGKQPGDLLCTNRKGGELYELRYWLEPSIAKSGVVDFTPKDIRHTFASRMVMDGNPIAAVAKWLGHSKVEMTYKRYAHLAPDANERAIATSMKHADEARLAAARLAEVGQVAGATLPSGTMHS